MLPPTMITAPTSATARQTRQCDRQQASGRPNSSAAALLLRGTLDERNCSAYSTLSLLHHLVTIRRRSGVISTPGR